jgi:hypothetical protein
MKTLALCTLFGIALLAGTGCGPTALERDFGATPEMSSRERFTEIGRNWSSDWRQMNDDIDHALLLRPESRLTIWNAR